MNKGKALKIAGIVSGILAMAWAALSVKAGFWPFRSIRVMGQADGPTSVFVAYIGEGARVMSWMIRAIPLILAAVSIACFLIRKKLLKKGESHE